MKVKSPKMKWPTPSNSSSRYPTKIKMKSIISSPKRKSTASIASASRVPIIIFICNFKNFRFRFNNKVKNFITCRGKIMLLKDLTIILKIWTNYQMVDNLMSLIITLINFPVRIIRIVKIMMFSFSNSKI